MVFVAACALVLVPKDEIRVVDPPIRLIEVRGTTTVKGFLVSKFEITNRQFKAFIRDTHYDGSDYPSSKTSEPFLMDWENGSFKSGKDNYPVCYLNWHHAKAFCDWLAAKSGRPIRLLTDQEWTLAATGGTGRLYPWGDNWDPKRCNWGDNGEVDGYKESAPVGSFARGATPEGIFDMAGNIWEWSLEGHLRGGPWCMGKDTVLCADVAREDTERCDDKFGLRVCVPAERSDRTHRNQTDRG